MTRFQTIFMGILVLLGIVGAVLFATAKNKGNGSAPQLVMWGTLPSQEVVSVLTKASQDYRDAVNVAYVEKNPATYENDLIAALARGQGPDLILLPQNLVIKQRDKFYAIPFDTYSERSFKDSFIEEGELYLADEGILGLPFSVDPIVMYWNRDMFGDAGVPLPPTSWTEFYTLVPKLTKKDGNGNITQSLIAFGEARNVTHAKDVLALLSIQAGTPIVSRTTGGYVSVFDRGGERLVPAEEALAYYTEFSNPLKPSYSWNRAMANDRGAFLAGKLAVYFGYASELSSLREANPNLNFDVALVPQALGKKSTLGRMNAIAILKSSPNISSAYVAAYTLTSSVLEGDWADKSGFPPVRRDLLTKLPGDAYKAVFYRSALISNGWLDPDDAGTNAAFARLVENVTSGKLRISESVRAASQEINNLIRSAQQ